MIMLFYSERHIIYLLPIKLLTDMAVPTQKNSKALIDAKSKRWTDPTF